MESPTTLTAAILWRAMFHTEMTWRELRLELRTDGLALLSEEGPLGIEDAGQHWAHESAITDPDRAIRGLSNLTQTFTRRGLIPQDDGMLPTPEDIRIDLALIEQIQESVNPIGESDVSALIRQRMQERLGPPVVDLAGALFGT